MTLPTSDAQSSRFLQQRQQPRTAPAHHALPPTRSIPAMLTLPSSAPQSTPPSPSRSVAELSNEIDHDRAVDFASHSWDLATGGLKTLTAKRELPVLLERRPTQKLPDTANVPRSYTFMLIILICLVLMLVSGGVVLFVMLQP